MRAFQRLTRPAARSLSSLSTSPFNSFRPSPSPFSLHFTSSFATISTSSSSSSGSPLTIYTLHVPQLSPSMTSATLLHYHSAPSSTITPADLLFTLSTSSLLASPSPPHRMLIECHDPGVVERLDEGKLGKEVGVNEVVGWMWEGEEERAEGKGRVKEIEEMIEKGEERKGDIVIKPFTWQAYMEGGEKQEDNDTPTRADTD